MFMSALVSILGIIDNSLAIVRTLVEAAKPEDRAAIVDRYEARIKRFESLGDWVKARLDKDDVPKAVPVVAPKV